MPCMLGGKKSYTKTTELYTQSLQCTLEIHWRSMHIQGRFWSFQEELKQSLVYNLKVADDEGLKKEYEVKRNEVYARHQTVSFEDKPKIMVYCPCKKFEVEGILCRHILKFSFKWAWIEYLRSTKNYILYQWTINVRYTSSATLETMKETQTSTISPCMILVEVQCTKFRI